MAWARHPSGERALNSGRRRTWWIGWPACRAKPEPSDGLSWSEQLSGTSVNLLDVAYGNGQFVAIGMFGDQSACIHSNDATNWTAGMAGPELPSGISYGAGSFVVTTYYGKIWSSSDCVNWRNRSWPVYMPLSGAAYGAGTFVAVGNYGAILQSGSLFTPVLELEWNPLLARPQIRLNGALGRTYRVDYQDRLDSGWVAWTNINLSAPQTSWTDDAADSSTRYYRAVLIP